MNKKYIDDLVLYITNIEKIKEKMKNNLNKTDAINLYNDMSLNLEKINYLLENKLLPSDLHVKTLYCYYSMLRLNSTFYAEKIKKNIKPRIFK